MNFEIHKKEDESINYFLINLDKNCLKNLKKNVEGVDAFEIDADALGIYAKLYSLQFRNSDTKFLSHELEGN